MWCCGSWSGGIAPCHYIQLGVLSYFCANLTSENSTIPPELHTLLHSFRHPSSSFLTTYYFISLEQYLITKLTHINQSHKKQHQQQLFHPTVKKNRNINHSSQPPSPPVGEILLHIEYPKSLPTPPRDLARLPCPHVPPRGSTH